MTAATTTPNTPTIAPVGPRVGRLSIMFAVAALAAVAAPFLPAYSLSIASEIAIFAILAMSIDLLAGFAGRTSLCHGAIFGVSAYVVIHSAQVAGLALPLCLLFGVLAAGAVAAVFALLAIRTSGVYFLLLTLALGMIVWGVSLRWTSVTGGENGLRGVVRPGWLAGQLAFFYVCLLVSISAGALAWGLVRSPFGLTLQGIRESESRMRSLGYNVALHLFLGFVVSGLIAGVGGALYAMYNGYVSPSTVSLSQSVGGLLMAIAGGSGTLFGAFIGATFVIVLQNVVSLFTERWMTALGATFILIMLFAPQGVIGLAGYAMNSRKRHPN